MVGKFHAEEGLYRLTLKEKFNFESEPDFRTSMSEVALHSCKKLAIDMSKVTYLDSAALSLLILARKRGQEEGFEVVLEGVHGIAEKIIRTAGFDQIFTITPTE